MGMVRVRSRNWEYAGSKHNGETHGKDVLFGVYLLVHQTVTIVL